MKGNQRRTIKSRNVIARRSRSSLISGRPWPRNNEFSDWIEGDLRSTSNNEIRTLPRPTVMATVMTPTIDTNEPGPCCTQADLGSTPCQARDGAGHLG